MNGTGHLIDMLESIKRTDEMISLHKNNDELPLITTQYEALKAKQVAEIIAELTTPLYLSAENFLVIKLIINKYYPPGDADKVQQKELKALAMAI